MFFLQWEEFFKNLEFVLEVFHHVFKISKDLLDQLSILVEFGNLEKILSYYLSKFELEKKLFSKSLRSTDIQSNQKRETFRESNILGTRSWIDLKV